MKTARLKLFCIYFSLLCAAGLILSPRVIAASFYVAAGGADTSPYDTWIKAAHSIHDAVAAATAAGGANTVYVTNGVYFLTNQVTIGNLTILSFKNGALEPTGTIINGNYPAYTNRCFYLTSTGAVVEGLTITNGFARDHGGGVRMTAGILRNCLVTGNTCSNDYNGGGIYAVGAGNIITNCDIIANLCWTPNMWRGGGGVLLHDGAKLMNSRVMFNQCPIYPSGGGGVRCITTSLVANCSIISNTTLDGWAGGGIFFQHQYNTIRNCLITGNDDGRQDYAAGIYAGQGTTQIIENCTIARNYGRGIGARPPSDPGVTLYLVNIINYSNTVAEIYPGQGTVIASNNCLTVTNYIPNFFEQANITNPPVFNDYAGGSFRLAVSSPCLNTGLNQSWLAEAADLDGCSRIDKFSGRVDMGCYEYLPQGMMFKVR